MDPLASERDPVLMTTPLAQRYYTDDEGVGGRVKVHPADFRVEEIPIYEPCGEGEHLYLRVQKTRVAHAELISCLRRAFDVPHKAIGFAGMKDKRAVTTQTISIQMHEDPPSLEIDHERIKILWAERHRNKIRRGHLKGNRFSIFIRDTDPMKAPRADRMLRKLERIGTPGYYGSQRFGYRLNNHLMGAALLREDWEGFLRELLGTTGSPFPKHQRERRTMFDEGRYKEAAALWTPADRAELVTVRKLAAGADAKTAVLAIRRADLSFYSTALASAIYNRTLDQRIEDGTADKLIEGDLAWKHDSRAVFSVTPEELATGELPGRLERMEISPSGPLWGSGMTLASGAVAEAEREAIAAAAVDEKIILGARYRVDGNRRPFRSPLTNIKVEGGVDDFGPYIRTEFDLTRGTYATIALREVMKSDDPSIA